VALEHGPLIYWPVHPWVIGLGQVEAMFTAEWMRLS
jgi:hypothetical protein